MTLLQTGLLITAAFLIGVAWTAAGTNSTGRFNQVKVFCNSFFE